MKISIAIAFSLMVAATPDRCEARSIRWPDLPVQVAERFDADAVRTDDQQRAETGELELYARTLRLFATSSNEGRWTTEGSERVCRIAVSSPGAQALELLLEDVSVPTGASLQLFRFNGEPLARAMSIALPQGVTECSTTMVHADEAVLEYRQPIEAPIDGRFTINGLQHAYRSVEDLVREGPCHVNVACVPESTGWAAAIDATVRISVVTPQGSGWCSGTLMNNVRMDCTPYILTAFHCGRTSTAAQFNQYKFYFNFQYASCAGGAYSTSQFVTGAKRIAFSDDYVQQYQGLGGSDFLLLRTNVDIPDTFQPFWAGWDATSISTVAADGVCIHHPTGAPKRISSYTQTLTTGHPMTSSGLMSHYRVRWAATPNGFGVTESGSSGAGLFKPGADGGPLLVATLTGSSSGMNCTNNGGTSYFGKMSYHWTNNPNTAVQKLNHWLDPDGTGTLVLPGSADPCGTIAGITTDAQGARLSVWPNPSHTVLYLELPGSLPRHTEALLSTSTGTMVRRFSLEARTHALNTADLPTGTYLLTVVTDDGAPPLHAKVMVMH